MLLCQIFVSLTIPWTTIRLIPHSLQDNITSILLQFQKPYGQIASKLGYSKAIISRLAKMVNLNMENLNS
jgi:hypothetical protein